MWTVDHPGDDTVVVDALAGGEFSFEFDLSERAVADFYLEVFCPSACCVWCRELFWIPDGTIPRTLATRDVPPPATVAVWAVPEDRPAPRLPNYAQDEIVHECHNGTPGPKEPRG